MDLGDFEFQLAPHLRPFVPLLADEILDALQTMPEHLAHKLAADLRVPLGSAKGLVLVFRCTV